MQLRGKRWLCFGCRMVTPVLLRFGGCAGAILNDHTLARLDSLRTVDRPPERAGTIGTSFLLRKDAGPAGPPAGPTSRNRSLLEWLRDRLAVTPMTDLEARGRLEAAIAREQAKAGHYAGDGPVPLAMIAAVSGVREGVVRELLASRPLPALPDSPARSCEHANREEAELRGVRGGMGIATSDRS